MSTRTRFVAALGLHVVALIAVSKPRGVGDAGEYYAIALNVSRGGAPALTAVDIGRVKTQLAEHQLIFPDVFPRLRTGERQHFERF